MSSLAPMLVAGAISVFVVLTLGSWVLSDGEDEDGPNFGGKYSEYDAPKGVRDADVGRGSDFGTSDDFGHDVDAADLEDEPFVDRENIDYDRNRDGGL